MAISKRAPGLLVSVDDTIDEIAAKALQAAREAEEKSKIKKESGIDKVKDPPKSPRTTPTPKKNPRN